MKEILKELNEAFMLLGSISLSGNAVDVMAAAKAKLRKVFQALKEIDAAGERAGRGPAPVETGGEDA